MKTLSRIFLLATALLGCAQAQSPPLAGSSRVPVVVELFTSDGCSSCPPADRLFSGLVENQPIPNAEVIALGMHVDYWDQLGWKDPASLALATARQQTYGRIWGSDRVYTPQIVVDGSAEMVGSDEGAVSRAIERAAAQPHTRVTETIAVDGNAVAAGVSIDALPSIKEPLDVMVLLTEDGLISNVKFGENAGRTLHHDAVVRSMYRLGPLTSEGPLKVRAALKPEWRRDHLHVVALVQGRSAHRIWGAASLPIR